MTDLTPEPVVDLDALAGAEPGASVAAGPHLLDAVNEQPITRLAGRARQGGPQPTGQGGLLAQLTKRLVESGRWRARSTIVSAPTATTRRRWRELPQRAARTPALHDLAGLANVRS